MQIERLSVIVPAYKQEKYILNDIENIYKSLKSTPYKFEIIVVVDGTSLDKHTKMRRKLNINL